METSSGLREKKSGMRWVGGDYVYEGKIEACSRRQCAAGAQVWTGIGLECRDMRQLPDPVCLRILLPSAPVSLQSLLIPPLHSSLVSSSFSCAHGLATSPAVSFPATATNRHQFLALSCQIPERKDSLGPVCAQTNCAIFSSRTDLPFY